MPRRVDLPGADELFRTTAKPSDAPAAPRIPDAAASLARTSPSAPATPEPSSLDQVHAPKPSGRVRHDEKITVYVSTDELLALERLRFTLRAEHGVAVDRGRIVRAAIADALADVRANGAEARLVQRLTDG